MHDREVPGSISVDYQMPIYEIPGFNKPARLFYRTTVVGLYEKLSMGI